jgi:outer membrane protein assembly factor BamB
MNFKKIFSSLIFIFILIPSGFSQKSDSINILIKTFRGNESRNYYGNTAPNKLKPIWKLAIGSGKSAVYGFPRIWEGAGWPGQPLLFSENGKLYLIQGAYDYNLRKIEAATGKVIWMYKFDDIIKSTGTIWENPKPDKPENKFVIMQGSRYGFKNELSDKVIPSYRAISLITGKELWRMNVGRTYSYSRDVDASSLVVNDTAYNGLENGIFVVFNPDNQFAGMRDSILQPKIYQEQILFCDSDVMLHGKNFVTEASPTLDGQKIIIAACSRVYAYNLKTKKLDWNFYLAADLDGTPVVTEDKKVIISLERQYIKGKGGIMKLDPLKPEKDAVEWFFPTENKKFGEWEGGVVGTVAVNDSYNPKDSLPNIAAFSGIDGNLYVIDYKKIDSAKTVLSPNEDTKYSTPQLLFEYSIGSGISSPVIVGNKIIATSSNGIYLFEYEWINGKFTMKLLDKVLGIPIEASPIVWNKKVYVASRNGFLYCWGE